MGNSFSKNNNNNELKKKPISQIIDYIATQYILTANFKSLENLIDKKYCDDLVILTSDIIDRYFTKIEVEYLVQRVEKGFETNKTDVIFFDKKNLDNFDTEKPLKKKRMCIGIAKYYIKIAHLFAAIVMTINPIYKYKNIDGNIETTTLFGKDKIPINTPRTITKINICASRIDSLTKNNTFIDLNNNITIQPNICSMNSNFEGNVKSLIEEPGIKELEELYYDNYDFVEGKFNGMKPETKKIYEEDLKIFYKVFTNSSTIPENIKSFKDISLKDYTKNKNCIGINPPLKEKFIGKYDIMGENIFSQYANHIKNMIYKTNKNQENLLNVINELFVYSTNPINNTREIRVNPTINDKKLNSIIQKTRNDIIKLYLSCEEDYKTGIKIYEKLVEKKIFENTKNQINTLNENIEKMYSYEKPLYNQSQKKDLSQDLTQKPEEELSQETEKELSQETEKELSQKPEEELSQKPEEELSQEPEEELSQEPEEELSQNEPQKLPENLTQRQEIPENLTQEIPENLKQEIPENLTQEIPENLTQEIPKEQITELPKEQITELPKDQITELAKEEIIELPKEQITELSKEEIIELPKEQITELHKNQITELAKEQITELPKEEITELPKEQITELPKEEIIELPKEEIIELPKEEIIKLPKEEIIELPKEQITELPKEEIIELPKEQIIELPKEESQKLTNKINTSYITK
jgi:hypothetical protein